MTESLVGAAIMLIGVFIGWVITSASSTAEKGDRGLQGMEGPQGPKGDTGLCQCEEDVGTKQGEGEYPPAPITDISTTDYWSGYKKGNVDDAG